MAAWWSKYLILKAYYNLFLQTNISINQNLHSILKRHFNSLLQTLLSIHNLVSIFQSSFFFVFSSVTQDKTLVPLWAVQDTMRQAIRTGLQGNVSAQSRFGGEAHRQGPTHPIPLHMPVTHQVPPFKVGLVDVNRSKCHHGWQTHHAYRELILRCTAVKVLTVGDFPRGQEVTDSRNQDWEMNLHIMRGMIRIYTKGIVKVFPEGHIIGVAVAEVIRSMCTLAADLKLTHHRTGTNHSPHHLCILERARSMTPFTRMKVLFMNKMNVCTALSQFNHLIRHPVFDRRTCTVLC